MYKSIKVHLGQHQDLIISIKIYLKYKSSNENAEFCALCIDNFKPRKVAGNNPPPQRPCDISHGQNRYVTLP